MARGGHKSGGGAPGTGGAAGAQGVPIRIIDPLCAVFRRKLRAEGLKYTPERARLLECVSSFPGLFEADAVLERATRDGVRVSRATVYRTLRLLQEAGIIQRVPFGDEPARYVMAYGSPGEGGQDLLIRLDTREAMPIDVPELASIRDALCARLGLEPKGHRLHVFATARE